MALDVDALLGSIETWRSGGRSLSELFIEAGANDVADDQLLSTVRDRLLTDTDLVEAWQGYSYDKRWSPSPYLDGLEVGHYDAGPHQVRRHESVVDACADFVLTEVRWILERRIVEAA